MGLAAGHSGPHHVRMWSYDYDALMSALFARGYSVYYWQQAQFVRYVAAPTRPLVVMEFNPRGGVYTLVAVTFKAIVAVWSVVSSHCWCPLSGAPPLPLLFSSLFSSLLSS